MNILIIAAHPDDEVLGMGGTIKKLSKKNRIMLGVISEGASAQYIDKKMIEIRKKAAINSGKVLGISKFEFINFSDGLLDKKSQLEINKEIEKMIVKFNPKIVYTTPSNDLHKDHQIVYESTLVATRPLSSNVKSVLSYEIPGIVKTPFNPNIFENIESELIYKIKAFKEYKSELTKFPHPRSIQAIKTLSEFRGMQSGMNNAEAFELIHTINS